ncbi:MAG: hypothetical protein COA45_07190 [Zetaproteobacteria bacterium]|nr:MAG: hypothetical protein COA45_07190 [Zetaproteobacteria bacterium]
MGFTKTSEGRVFFKNADNDDLPVTRSSKPIKDPILPSDTIQMQTLLLLKSLNTKLKDSKSDNATFKKQLVQYKATIKILEDKTSAQETNYIDLEQKIASKQSEASKKTSRVENSVKNTLKQIEEAKDLVKKLERQNEERDGSLDVLKEQVTQQKSKDTALLKRQRDLETQQKAQGEKMVDNVAVYVALTKRVSETETRNEALDNKIEDATSEYLKLDRKIDKAIEDRNRILRKVDRIEQAVLETRDALNAKAMVLLTDQGAVAGVNMPQINDDILQTDPSILNKRLQEENLLPWWRRSIRIQGTSLALLMVVGLLLGWILSEARQPAPTIARLAGTSRATSPPTISLHTPSTDTQKQAIYSEATQYSDESAASTYDNTNDTSYENPYDIVPESGSSFSSHDLDTTAVTQDNSYTRTETATEIYEKAIQQASSTPEIESDYGITIHKGYSDEDMSRSYDDSKHAVTTHIDNTIDGIETLDIFNDAQMLAALNDDPERVARRLNQIEPQNLAPESLTTEDKTDAPAAAWQKPQQAKAPSTHTKATPSISYDAYIAELKQRIKPDKNLSDIAKKIEIQAFAGVPEAQHDMGAIYVTGHGKIKKNLDRAILWFEEAADNGIANAKYNLGVLHHQGLGVTQSIKNAMALYEEAANLGHPEAQYNLGIAHIEGIGVPYNPKRAAHFFEMAAHKDVTEAAYNLGLIYENGLLGETRPEDALLWYKAAADQGSPEAQSALDQLATSLGIGIDEVNRIVANLQKPAYKQTRYGGGSASDSAESYLTSQVQKELMRRGLYPGPVDGMSGPMTRDAIRAFQTATDMTVDGRPSQKLLSYLKVQR